MKDNRISYIVRNWISINQLMPIILLYSASSYFFVLSQPFLRQFESVP